MDKFECLVQAFEYEQRTHGEKNLEEFQGLSSKIESDEGKAWLKLLQQEREAHFSRRKQRTPVIFVIGILFYPYLTFVLTMVQESLALGRRPNALCYRRNLVFMTFPWMMSYTRSLMTKHTPTQNS
jgi:hypothetical protein